jgi:hypothetical protein
VRNARPHPGPLPRGEGERVVRVLYICKSWLQSQFPVHPDENRYRITEFIRAEVQPVFADTGRCPMLRSFIHLPTRCEHHTKQTACPVILDREPIETMDCGREVKVGSNCEWASSEFTLSQLDRSPGRLDVGSFIWGRHSVREKVFAGHESGANGRAALSRLGHWPGHLLDAAPEQRPCGQGNAPEPQGYFPGWRQLFLPAASSGRSCFWPD